MVFLFIRHQRSEKCSPLIIQPRHVIWYSGHWTVQLCLIINLIRLLTANKSKRLQVRLASFTQKLTIVLFMLASVQSYRSPRLWMNPTSNWGETLYEKSLWWIWHWMSSVIHHPFSCSGRHLCYHQRPKVLPCDRCTFRTFQCGRWHDMVHLNHLTCNKTNTTWFKL